MKTCIFGACRQRSKEKPALDRSTLARSNDIRLGAIANHKTNVTSISSPRSFATNIIALHQAFDNYIYEQVFAEMVGKNAKVRDAIAETREMLAMDVMSERDISAIVEELGKVKGFEPLGTGLVLKFAAYTGVVVPGRIFGRRLNAHLIRVSDGRWFLLETK